MADPSNTPSLAIQSSGSRADFPGPRPKLHAARVTREAYCRAAQTTRQAMQSILSTSDRRDDDVSSTDCTGSDLNKAVSSETMFLAFMS